MRMLMGALLLCAAGAANADWTEYLQGRDLDGNGTADAYYDAAMNVTFLGDANYAATVGFMVGVKHPDLQIKLKDGQLTWIEARDWLSTLSIGTVGGWRTSNTFYDNCPVETCSRFDESYETELTRLYDQLGGSTGPFTNVMVDGLYLTGNHNPYFQNSTWMLTGFGGDPLMENHVVLAQEMLVYGYSWLTHDGDVGAAVSPVPEPSTYAMLFAGLAAVGFFSRRRRGNPSAWL